MQLAVVGTRSGMPEPGEPSSGYVVRAGGTAILLDCGPGVAGALPAVAAPADLDAVFLSHLHLDHCHDVLPVAKKIVAPYVAYPGYPGSQQRAGTPVPVPLFVSPGGKQTLLTLQGLFPTATAPMLDRALELAFDITEYDTCASAVIGDCTVTAFPVRRAVRPGGCGSSHRQGSSPTPATPAGPTTCSSSPRALTCSSARPPGERRTRDRTATCRPRKPASSPGWPGWARSSSLTSVPVNPHGSGTSTPTRHSRSADQVQLAAPGRVFEVADRELESAMKEVQTP